MHVKRWYTWPVFLLLAGTALADPTPVWTDLHDGGAGAADQALLVRVAPDGHPVVAGESHDGVGGSDILVRKLDREDHHLLWERRLDSGELNDVTVSGMAFDAAGDLLLGGHVLACDG